MHFLARLIVGFFAALALMFVVRAIPALGQDTPMINYQGQLNDSSGQPVPDGSYQISFSLWDAVEGGTLLWSETHPEVQTTNGVFSVLLGSIEPLNRGTFDTEIVAMELQAETDPPMTPRIRLVEVPTTVIARRVNGDVVTEPNMLKIHPPDPDSQPALVLSSDGLLNQILMNLPQDDGAAAVEMSAVLNSTTFRMGVDPQPFSPSLEMNLDPTAGVINLINDRSDGSAASLGISSGLEETGIIIINGRPDGSTASAGFSSGLEETGIVIVNGRPDGSTASAEFSSGLEEAGIVIVNNQPEGDMSEVAINVSPNSATFRMGVQPEPFSPPVEINSSLNSTTFRMGVEPEPFSPLLEMNLDPTAGAINLINERSDGSTASLGISSGMEETGIVIVDSRPDGSTASAEFSSSLEEAGIIIVNGRPEGGSTSAGLSSGMEEAGIVIVNNRPEGGSASAGISSGLQEAGIVIVNNRPDGEYSGMAMSSQGDGSWSWGLFSPKPEPPGRPVAEMSTGLDGEFSWVMFSPKPEPPEPIMEMMTSSAGPSFVMTAPQPAGGRLEITEPMLQMTAESSGSQINLKKVFTEGTNDDSTGIKLSTDSLKAELGLFGPGSDGNATVRILSDANGGQIGIGADPTNILTVKERSATDPIADAWTTYSSRRWKENIETLDGAVEKIRRLRGVSFDWKADGSHDIGLIAEEVGRIFPEVVAYEENGIDAKSVDYARLVAVLIEAVKEQQETIERMKARLDEADGLKARLSQLTEIVNDLAARIETFDDVRYVHFEETELSK